MSPVILIVLNMHTHAWIFLTRLGKLLKVVMNAYGCRLFCLSYMKIHNCDLELKQTLLSTKKLNTSEVSSGHHL